MTAKVCSYQLIRKDIFIVMLVYVILRQCCGSYGHAIGSITSNRPRITRFSLQNRFINNVVLFSSYNHPFSLSKSVSGAFSNGLRLSSICLPIRRDITPFSGLFSTKCIDIEDTVNSSQVSSDDVNQSVVDTNIDVLDDIDEETAIEDEDDDMVEDNDDIITELEALNRKDTAISAESKKKSKKSPNMPFELDMKDVVETVAKGGGPGGQHINKCSNRVRLQHVPTGIIVACQDFRDLTSNRKHAYTMLREKVWVLKPSYSS